MRRFVSVTCVFTLLASVSLLAQLAALARPDG